MEYTVIDLERWPRREFYEHYMRAVPCTYSMTVRLDITNIRRRGYRLYPALLWQLTCAVDACEPFRMALRGDELVCYRRMRPCFTVFHAGSGSFSNLWTEHAESWPQFLRQYEETLGRWGGVEGFSPQGGMPEDCFTVSMLPWAEFEGFNINTPGFGYLKPIFTLGRFRESGGSTSLPLALQAHHAVCDGYHACRFLGILQDGIGSM